MEPIAILYATREGHCHRIAQSVALTLRSYGFDVDVKNLRDSSPAVAPSGYSAAVLIASVHVGKHEREMVKYVKCHRIELMTMPTAFLSVSLSQAGAEMLESSPEARARSSSNVHRMTDKFLADTGWHPTWVKPVAGALLYTKYNPVVKFVMKWIAKQEGADTDTTRDYVYTDWDGLDRFIGGFAEHLLLLPASDSASPEVHRI